MKGLYLHGYQGKVTEEKKEFLNSLGTIYTPIIDYDSQSNLWEELVTFSLNNSLDFVSGTSLGGIFAYYLSLKLNLPCLLFNPAVTYINAVKSVIDVEDKEFVFTKEILVLIGEKDSVIPAKEQYNFFWELKQKGKDITIHKDAELEHYVDMNTFSREFIFFKDYIS